MRIFFKAAFSQGPELCSDGRKKWQRLFFLFSSLFSSYPRSIVHAPCTFQFVASYSHNHFLKGVPNLHVCLFCPTYSFIRSSIMIRWNAKWKVCAFNMYLAKWEQWAGFWQNKKPGLLHEKSFFLRINAAPAFVGYKILEKQFSQSFP